MSTPVYRDDEFPYEIESWHKASSIYESISNRDRSSLSKRNRYLLDIYRFQESVCPGGMHSFFLYHGIAALDTLEALDSRGARQAHDWLKRACDGYPGGIQSKTLIEIQRQLYELSRAGKSLDDAIPEGDIEYELYDLLCDYWQRERPTVIEVAVHHVKSAKQLLDVLAVPLEIKGGYGNDLDTFLDDASKSADRPHRLVLRGGLDLAKTLKGDVDTLLCCWNDVNERCLDAGCEIELA